MDFSRISMINSRVENKQPMMIKSSSSTSKIDDAVITIAQLVEMRLSFMEQVAAYKWHHTLAIEDPGQEEKLLMEIKQQASLLDLDMEQLISFFKWQFNAAKQLQHYWFSVWEEIGFLYTLPLDLNGAIRFTLRDLGLQMIKKIKDFSSFNEAESDGYYEKLFVQTLKKAPLSNDQKYELFHLLVAFRKFDI